MTLDIWTNTVIVTQKSEISRWKYSSIEDVQITGLDQVIHWSVADQDITPEKRNNCLKWKIQVIESKYLAQKMGKQNSVIFNWRKIWTKTEKRKNFCQVKNWKMDRVVLVDAIVENWKNTKLMVFFFSYIIFNPIIWQPHEFELEYLKCSSKFKKAVNSRKTGKSNMIRWKLNMVQHGKYFDRTISVMFMYTLIRVYNIPFKNIRGSLFVANVHWHLG